MWASHPDASDPAAQMWTLIERAKQGDSEAFGLIYRHYYGTVFNFIPGRIGSHDLAEDLTQKTFIRALGRIGSFTWQGRDIGAWLVTIARNLVIDYSKSSPHRREVLHELNDLGTVQIDQTPEGAPEQTVVDYFTNIELLRALERLTPEQRECIVLRFLRDLTLEEIAQIMRKDYTAIKAMQYRALRTLRRHLGEGFRL